MRRLGYLALEQNDILNAKKYFQESLTFNYETGDKPGVTASLTSLAALAIHLDKPVVAARLYGKVESQLESLSINMLFLDQGELGRIRNKLLTTLDEAAFTAAFAEGWEMSEEQAIELAERVFGEGD